MIKYILDIFCNDTIIGLCQIDDLNKNKLFKNNQMRLFKQNSRNLGGYNQKFIDPIAYHL